MPPTEPSAGIEAIFLANRAKLMRFLLARGAGDSAEDLVQEVWLKVSTKTRGPIASPLAYLFRTADTLMIDRFRSRRQAERRDQAWSVERGAGLTEGDPSAERIVAARQAVARLAEVIEGLGERRATIFRRARLEGIAQRQIAVELGISLSTVESELRIACRVVAETKEAL